MSFLIVLMVVIIFFYLLFFVFVLVKKIKPKSDISQRIFAIPEALLKFTNMWPKNRNLAKKLYFFIMISITTLMEIGQVVYIVLNVTNLMEMASAMSTISTTFQAITKITILHIHSRKLKHILEIVEKEFWPSDLMGDEVANLLKFNSNLTASGMISVFISAMCFSVLFLSAPQRNGVRDLPFASKYPFDWKPSPVYEITYLLQCFVNECFIVPGICGHDNMFLVLSVNCVSQFELLKRVVGKIGSDQADVTNKKLDRYYKNGSHKYVSGNEGLFVRCTEHHLKLIRIFTDLELIFSFTIAVQLLSSVTAICVSSFLISMQGLDASQLTHLFSYCVGHIVQLFIFCAAGNELAFQAYDFSSHVFKSKWYEENVTIKVKKGLMFLMQRSQKQQRLTAMGVVGLNYSTFFKVMRLSFSFYTLLSSITDK